MGFQEIHSREAFDALIQSGGVALIDYNAPWCAPCRLQEPILKELAVQFEGKVPIAAINVDELPKLAADLGIQSIPTLIIYKNSKEIQRFVGIQAQNVLAETLSRAMA
ncbi:MAG: thioredoxin family protein [Thermodesulfobacteriota bacterium]